MFDWFFALLRPIEWVVAWIMVQFHTLLTAAGLPESSGWTWGLSIVGLVIVIRIVLIPLFVKQINASRGMQLIQPEMRKIQEKYKGKKDEASRQAMTKETMDLYKRTGTNPFASCLPILLQSPIFFALFRVLNENVVKQKPIGVLTADLARPGGRGNHLRRRAVVDVPELGRDRGQDRHGCSDHPDVADDVHDAEAADDEEHAGERDVGKPLHPAAEDAALRAARDLRGVGCQLPDRRAPVLADHEPVVDGPAVLRDPPPPAPGSLAEKALEERRAKRGKAMPTSLLKGRTPEPEPEPEPPKKGQRQQPKRKDRKKRPPGAQRPNGANGTGGSGGSGAGETGPNGAAGKSDSDADVPDPDATGRSAAG